MNLHPKVLEIWGRQLWVIRWHKWEFKFSPEDLCDNFHLTGNKICVSSNYRRAYLFFTYIFFPVFFIHENLRTSTVCGGGGWEEERVLCFLFSTILTSLSYGDTYTPGGGTRIIFWRGVQPEVRNPYPYLRIFHPQKTADFTFFFRNFRKLGPISKGFSTSKMADFTIFSQFLWHGILF